MIDYDIDMITLFVTYYILYMLIKIQSAKCTIVN